MALFPRRQAPVRGTFASLPALNPLPPANLSNLAALIRTPRSGPRRQLSLKERVWRSMKLFKWSSLGLVPGIGFVTGLGPEQAERLAISDEYHAMRASLAGFAVHGYRRGVEEGRFQSPTARVSPTYAAHVQETRLRETETASRLHGPTLARMRYPVGVERRIPVVARAFATLASIRYAPGRRPALVFARA